MRNSRKMEAGAALMRVPTASSRRFGEYGHAQIVHRRRLWADGGFLRLRDRPDWEEIRERIAAQLPDTVPSAEANRLIQELGASSQSKMVESAYAPLNQRADFIDEMQVSWQASLAAAELADLISMLIVVGGGGKVIRLGPVAPPRNVSSFSGLRAKRRAQDRFCTKGRAVLTSRASRTGMK